MILHKIYDSWEEVNDDLQEFNSDNEKKSFLEKVKADKEEIHRENPQNWEMVPDDELQMLIPDPSFVGDYPEVSKAINEDEVIQYCEYKIAFLEKKLEISGEAYQRSLVKIKWNGSPEIFGYLFLELVRKGYLDVPLYHGKPNFTGFSRLCGEHFQIDTTPGNLERALNEENNQLSQYKRERFTIPPLSEIA